MDNSLESETKNLSGCLECSKGAKFKAQIQQNMEKYEGIIKAEINKLPTDEPNITKIAYCKGAVEQLRDITTLTERALFFISEIVKAKNMNLRIAHKDKKKFMGRL